jgi:hypothetical protein
LEILLNPEIDRHVKCTLRVTERFRKKIKALRSFDNADGRQPSITANPNDAGATTKTNKYLFKK